MSSGSNPVGEEFLSTDAMAKGKGRYEGEAAPFSAQNPLSDTSGNVLSGASHDVEMDFPAEASSSTSTLLTIPPHLVSDTPMVSSPTRPRSHPLSRDNSPHPRSSPSSPRRSATPTAASSGRPVPPRRSARTLSKAYDRPLGPPELEAALTIAIRNLESDVYEWWCANQKPGDPIPTTAYLKGRSRRIRKAADAVDEADRLVNEAVYGKTRKGRPSSKKSQGKAGSVPRTTGDIPDNAFEQLELKYQAPSPLRQTVTEANTNPPNRSGGEASRSGRSVESVGE